MQRLAEYSKRYGRNVHKLSTAVQLRVSDQLKLNYRLSHHFPKILRRFPQIMVAPKVEDFVEKWSKTLKNGQFRITNHGN